MRIGIKWRNRRLGCAAWCLAAVASVAGAQERDTYNVKNAFRESVSLALPSTVRILADLKLAALGTVVDADGYILTKASQLKGDLMCQFFDGQRREARVVGVRDDYDLAMLKVEAKNLPVITWSDAEVPPVGSWLATPGMETLPVAIGVVSVAPRLIERRLPAMGIILDESEDGPRVHEVVPDSGAAAAGLKANDVVTHLNDKPVQNRDSLIRSIRDFRPGDKVKLRVRRAGEERRFDVVLGELAQITMGHRDQFQNSLGGPLSERRAGFPLALQHDTVLKPNQCGGPLLGLDGKAVGINIARASRVGSLAIPAAAVKPLLDELKNGKPVTATPAN